MGRVALGLPPLAIEARYRPLDEEAALIADLRALGIGRAVAAGGGVAMLAERLNLGLGA